MLKGANVEGAYWIPEGVEEIEPRALIGCKIGTLHIPWTAHVHEYDQLVFSEDPEENEEMMPCVYFWTKEMASKCTEFGTIKIGIVKHLPFTKVLNRAFQTEPLFVAEYEKNEKRLTR